MEALKDTPMDALAWALGRAKDELTADNPEERKTTPPASDLAPFGESLLDSRSDVAANRVGRNDPCPCGSGKKYKKCCMRKPLD